MIAQISGEMYLLKSVMLSPFIVSEYLAKTESSQKIPIVADMIRIVKPFTRIVRSTSIAVPDTFAQLNPMPNLFMLGNRGEGEGMA
jgi:hypothetical protein